MSFNPNEITGQEAALISTERMTQALGLLDRFDSWNWADARRFVTVGVLDTEKQRAFFGMIERAITRGFKNPSEAFTNFDTELRIAMPETFHSIDKLAGITGLGSLVFVPDGGPESWKIQEAGAKVLVANYFEGNVGVIRGVLGTGKTDFGCYLIEQWLASDTSVVAFSNIKMNAPVDRYYRVTRASEFFKNLCALPPGTRILFVPDEGRLFYSKPDQATKRVKNWDTFMMILRKLHCSLVMIIQRDNNVPDTISEFSMNNYRCIHIGGGMLSFELKGPKLAMRKTVKDVPRTKLPYNTYDWAYFDMDDINLNDLLIHTTGADEPLKAVQEYMEKPKSVKGQKAFFARECSACGNTFQPDDGRQRLCDTCKTKPHPHQISGANTEPRKPLTDFLK